MPARGREGVITPLSSISHHSLDPALTVSFRSDPHFEQNLEILAPTGEISRKIQLPGLNFLGTNFSSQALKIIFNNFSSTDHTFAKPLVL